jgi:hypothetical protein
MKYNILLPAILLWIGSLGCSQSPSQETQMPPLLDEKGKTVGMQIDTNATFVELVAEFPELELPFPRLVPDTTEKFEVRYFPSGFARYYEIHPEKRIPNRVANLFLDIDTPKLDEHVRKNPVFIATAVGKVTQEGFVVLIYNVARMEGASYGKSGKDTTYNDEFKIATFAKEGKKIGSHHFGYENSSDWEDSGCAELLPDLTANVYDNPHCLVPNTDENCRVDHHITIQQDGTLKVKSKKYK